MKIKQTYTCKDDIICVQYIYISNKLVEIKEIDPNSEKEIGEFSLPKIEVADETFFKIINNKYLSNNLHKVIVAGGREFNDYSLLKESLDHLLKNKFPYVQIVSGTARGADKLGEQYAKENKLTIRQFPADWDTYGKSAGYRRNADMADYADACVVFWDGKSKGTKHMIDLAEKKGIELRVINYIEG